SFPATSRAVADWFPQKERGTVTAIYLTGVRFGAALINWIGGLYFAAKGDWRLFFLITGLAPLLWLAPWTKLVRKLETDTGSLAGRKAPAKKSVSFWKSVALLRRRSVLGIFLGFFAYDYAWFVFITWLPSYLRKERGFTESEMGL